MSTPTSPTAPSPAAPAIVLIAHRHLRPAWLNTIADHLETTARTSPERTSGVVLDRESVRRLTDAFAPVADLRCVATPRGSEGWVECVVTLVSVPVSVAEEAPMPADPLNVPTPPVATLSQAEIATQLRPAIRPPHPVFQALEEASCALFVAEERARRAMALTRQFGGLSKLEHTLWETYGQLYERLYDLQQLVGQASGEDSIAVALTQRFVNGRRRASDLIDQMGGL